jgi:hypothetical protein
MLIEVFPHEDHIIQTRSFLLIYQQINQYEQICLICNQAVELYSVVNIF